MDDILVSVIVPVYNSKMYLEACLDSIVNQSYKNLEIILIDDGSTDGSSNILDLYATKDDRIKVIHNTNHGVSYSRNYGIKMAAGDKILFIDSDDTVDLDYVKKLVEPLEQGSYDLVIAGANDVKIENNRARARKFPSHVSGVLREDFNALFLVPCITAPWGKLYDLKIMKENKCFFSEEISFNEDVLFNVGYLRYVKTYEVVKQPLYNYCRRKGMSLSKNRSDKNFNGALWVASELKKFLLDKQIVNGGISLTHLCLNHLKWFAITDGGYAVFKKRAEKIRTILDGMYATKGNKRAINVWLLKNNMTMVLYTMYFFREKFKL